MAEYDPNRLPGAGQVQEPICSLCLEHNPIGQEVCRRCRTPLVTITGPKFDVDPEVYRKPVALIGTWLMGGLPAAMCIGMIIWSIRSTVIQAVGSRDLLTLLGIAVFIIFLGCVTVAFCMPLFRATRTFILHRRRPRPPRRAFEPIMSDQSNDRPS